MSEFDVVGFQTRAHLQDYLDCSRRICGFTVKGDDVLRGKRRVRGIVDPIGIDAPAFARVSRKPASWPSPPSAASA